MQKHDSEHKSIILRLTPKDVSEITKIHIEALKGDFLPSLGFKFLNTFYSGIIDNANVYGFVFKNKGKILGFIIGTGNSDIFFNEAIKAKFITLSFYLLLRFLQKPTILKNVFETFFYPSKDKGPKAELVVIAVSDKYRGKGIGKKLTKVLEKAFTEHNIKKYKVTVHKDKEAVYFYEHLGYSRINTFNLYSKTWFSYEKKI